MQHKLLIYLQSLLADDLPFLAYREASGKVVKVISQKDKQLHTSCTNCVRYAVFSGFQSDNLSYYIKADQYETFNFCINDDDNQSVKTDLNHESKDDYIDLVNNAVKKIKTSDLKKIVLSRKQTFLTSKTTLQLFEKLLTTYPKANNYFFSHPQIGKWMGATPELLLKVRKDQISTMSLAGTAVYKNTLEHIWGDKELEEQQIVTDYIINQLAESGLENIKAQPLETIIAGNLIHLRTLINATRTNTSVDTIIKSLHPTPAVCGLPTHKAYQFILDNENYDRSFYTGYWGAVDGDDADYYVNLRCMKIFDKHVDIYVGGGITSQSNALEEYLETVNKLNTMRKVL